MGRFSPNHGALLPKPRGHFPPNHAGASPQTTGVLLPKPPGCFSPNHGGTSPQTTGVLLPKPRGCFSPNHATPNVPRPVLPGSRAVEYSGACPYAAARTRTGGGSCRVLARSLHKLTACGVQYVYAAAHCVGSMHGVTCSRAMDRGIGVRHAACRGRQMRAGLASHSTLQATATWRERPGQYCQATHTPCVAGVRYLWRELRTRAQCGSITPTIVWWADVCPRGSGASTRSLRPKRERVLVHLTRCGLYAACVITMSCRAALQGAYLHDTSEEPSAACSPLRIRLCQAAMRDVHHRTALILPVSSWGRPSVPSAKARGSDKPISPHEQGSIGTTLARWSTVNV